MQNTQIKLALNLMVSDHGQWSFLTLPLSTHCKKWKEKWATHNIDKTWIKSITVILYLTEHNLSNTRTLLKWRDYSKVALVTCNNNNIITTIVKKGEFNSCCRVLFHSRQQRCPWVAFNRAVNLLSPLGSGKV